MVQVGNKGSSVVWLRSLEENEENTHTIAENAVFDAGQDGEKPLQSCFVLDGAGWQRWPCVIRH